MTTELAERYPGPARHVSGKLGRVIESLVTTAYIAELAARESRAALTATLRLGGRALGHAWRHADTVSSDESRKQETAETLRSVEKHIVFNNELLTLRRATPDDYTMLRRLYDELSPADSHNRFMSAVNEPGAYFLTLLNNPRVPSETYVIGDTKGSMIAECTAYYCDDGIIDVAYVVADGYRGRQNPDQLRLGGTLFKHVLDVAAADASVQTVHADVLTSNHPSSRLLMGALEHHEAFGRVRITSDYRSVEIQASKI